MFIWFYALRWLLDHCCRNFLRIKLCNVVELVALQLANHLSRKFKWHKIGRWYG